MFKENLQIIVSKIENIEEIVKEYGSISQALSNTLLARPAILMHLIAMAEQFDRLKKDEATEILKAFDEKDLKGAYSIRNFIAHDYEGVNISMIELTIREKLPKIKKITETLLASSDKE